MPTLDLALGPACLLLWWGLLRPGLVALLPAAMRARTGPVRRFPLRRLPLAVASGALTHVVWDAFTHRGRLGSTLLPVLADRVGPFALTSWAQYASTAGGLLLLAGAAVVAHRRTPPEGEGASPLGPVARPIAGAVVLIPALLAVAAVAVGAWSAGAWSWSGAAFTAATTALPALAATLAVTGLLTRLRAARSSPPSV